MFYNESQEHLLNIHTATAYTSHVLDTILYLSLKSKLTGFIVGEEVLHLSLFDFNSYLLNAMFFYDQ